MLVNCWTDQIRFAFIRPFITPVNRKSLAIHNADANELLHSVLIRHGLPWPMIRDPKCHTLRIAWRSASDRHALALAWEAPVAWRVSATSPRRRRRRRRLVMHENRKLVTLMLQFLIRELPLWISHECSPFSIPHFLSRLCTLIENVPNTTSLTNVVLTAPTKEPDEFTSRLMIMNPCFHLGTDYQTSGMILIDILQRQN